MKRKNMRELSRAILHADRSLPLQYQYTSTANTYQIYSLVWEKIKNKKASPR